MNKGNTYRGNIAKLNLAMLTNDANFGLGVYVIYLVQLGLSLAQVSMIVSAWLIFSSIGQIPSGIFADRFGYRTALLSGSIIFTIGTVLATTKIGNDVHRHVCILCIRNFFQYRKSIHVGHM